MWLLSAYGKGGVNTLLHISVVLYRSFYIKIFVASLTSFVLSGSGITELPYKLLQIPSL
jgi:hypothetical protein